jgi:hypothetical protein
MCLGPCPLDSTFPEHPSLQENTWAHLCGKLKTPCRMSALGWNCLISAVALPAYCKPSVCFVSKTQELDACALFPLVSRTCSSTRLWATVLMVYSRLRSADDRSPLSCVLTIGVNDCTTVIVNNIHGTETKKLTKHNLVPRDSPSCWEGCEECIVRYLDMQTQSLGKRQGTKSK